MGRFRLLLCLLFVASTAAASSFAAPASDVRPFASGSMAAIRAAHAGHPFIVSFWSVDCVHCPKELKRLGALKKMHPALDIVLVAADAPELAETAARMAAGSGLARVEQWIFADDRTERLRFEIDPEWHGELPRTYFFEPHKAAAAVSGVVPEARLARWAAAHGHASGARPE